MNRSSFFSLLNFSISKNGEKIKIKICSALCIIGISLFSPHTILILRIMSPRLATVDISLLLLSLPKEASTVLSFDPRVNGTQYRRFKSVSKKV